MDTLWGWFLELNRFSAIPGCLYFLFSKPPLKRLAGVLFFILLASGLADNLNYFFLRIIYPNSFYIGNTWIIFNYFLTILLFWKLLNRPAWLFVLFAATYLIGTCASFLFVFGYDEANTFSSTFSNLASLTIT